MPDGAALFFVVLVLLFVFLGFVLVAAAAGFLSVLALVSASAWANDGELAAIKQRLKANPNQDLRQDKLNLKTILSALLSIKTMRIIYLAWILKPKFYTFFADQGFTLKS